jgi:hypothetical protein
VRHGGARSAPGPQGAPPAPVTGLRTFQASTKKVLRSLNYTSASAERLFSIDGRAYDDLCQRMKEEMLEMLMWAHVNREKRHAKAAKRSSSDIDGLGRSGGESGGDGEVRVWRNVLISAGTVATTL